MRLYALSAFLTALLVASSHAQDLALPAGKVSEAGLSEARLDALHRRMAGFVENGTVAGFVTLIAKDGRVVEWRVGGQRDIAAGLPMEKNNIFCVYSITKIMTAVAVLQLMEEGKLRLDDPAENYLPKLRDRRVWLGGTQEAPQTEPAKTPITIRQLLTHSAGYYYDKNADDPALKKMSGEVERWAPQTPEEFLRYVATLPLHDQPGTRYRYSLGYDILGVVVERVAGKSLEDVMQEKMFRPLGMADTSFLVPAEKRVRMARIYRRDEAGKLVVDDVAESRVPTRGSFYAGGGGLFSTAGDLARLGQMLLNRGQLEGVRVLSLKTVDLMTSDQLRGLPMPLVSFTARDTYGLGVGVATDLGKSSSLGSVGNFGWTGAATTLLQMDPKQRMVLMVLCQLRPANQDVYGTFINMAYAALEP